MNALDTLVALINWINPLSKRKPLGLINIIRRCSVKPGDILVFRCRNPWSCDLSRMMTTLRKAAGPNVVGLVLGADDTLEHQDSEWAAHFCKVWLNTLKDEPEVWEAAHRLLQALERRKVKALLNEDHVKSI